MKVSFSSFLALCSIIFLSSCANKKEEIISSQKIGFLQISNGKPQPGDKLELDYNPDANEKEGTTEVFYHYFVGTKAYVEDLQIKDSAGSWKANFIIPDSATAVIFHITSNGKRENNDKKGYVLPLYNTQGEILPGSNASQGLFYAFYGNEYEVENKSFLSLIKEDLENNPDLKKDWDEYYARLLYDSDKEKGKAYISERIKKRSGVKADEKDLTTIYHFYNLLKERKAADSVHQIIAEKYPLNEVVKQKYIIDFRNLESLDEREKLFKEFNEKFGAEESGFEKNYILDMLITSFASREKWEKFEDYANFMTDKDRQASTYNNIAWEMGENDKNLEKASELSKQSLELIKDAKKPDYLTTNQFQLKQKYTTRMFLDTYAYILMKQGNFEEAVKHQEKAVADGMNSEYNERYIKLLIATEQPQNAVKAAEDFIKKNTATDKVKELYKAAYVKATGSSLDFKTRLAELESLGLQKAIAETKEAMLNEEAPNFNLEDLEGNPISLTSLKGKVVILDFWATWCGPCIASFPGMQKAVEKYENDEQVIFLFVNTMENKIKRNENVRDFIQKNSYSFQVLMDKTVNPDSHKFSTASAFNVTGIPTKIVIGPDGKIRFKNTGYGGNNEQMIKELDIMINILKEQKSHKKKNTA